MLDGRVERGQLGVRPADVDWIRTGALAIEVQFARPRPVSSNAAVTVRRLLIPLGPEAEARFGPGAVMVFWSPGDEFVAGPFARHDRALLDTLRKIAGGLGDEKRLPPA